MYVAGGVDNIYRNSPRVEVFNITERRCTGRVYDNCTYALDAPIALRKLILSSIH